MSRERGRGAVAVAAAAPAPLPAPLRPRLPQVRTDRPMRRCCVSTATTSRRQRGAARAPGPASGTPSAGTSGKACGGWRVVPAGARVTPGSPPPHGRCHRRDAWHSLGRMSKEEAMAAYVAEMKKVAQKVPGRGKAGGALGDPRFELHVPSPRSLTRCPWTRRRRRCSSTSSRSTR